MSRVYDVAILGAGPAGLSAALYAGRSRLSVLMIERGQDGGQIASTDDIENYPGQKLEGESGRSLTERMAKQAENFGAERTADMIESVDFSGNVKVLKGNREDYLAKNVIIATGASPRPIGCKGEDEFRGRGLSYCATCDANFFEGLEVFVVGGGDAAVEEAVYLTKFAKKVTIIHRRNELRAAKSIQERAFANPKIDFMWDTVVEELSGEDVLRKITVKNVETGETRLIEAPEEDGMFGVFSYVGTIPNSGLFRGLLDMDEKGYIRTDENMHTSLPNIYAVGDVRVKSLRQVVTAAADGAIAAVQVERSLSDYI